MAAWRFSREDLGPVILIALLPLFVAVPQLCGWVVADPALRLTGIHQEFVGGLMAGVPHIDPNDGVTTQALGYRAALDWLSGIVPWWNPYSGVGLPLAAEYQPAAFFPLTILIVLPLGMTWLQLSLQILCGLGTYALLRQLGLRRLAATTGGIAYAFNGTLAWFAHAPALPVPFLPWMLLGIERARVAAALGSRGGWRLFAAAMSMALLAGFPETAYIGGLLALAWSVLRLVQMPRALRIGYTMRVIAGGTVGIALAAPQILAFFEYLPHADLGGHAGTFAHSALPIEALVPTLIAPYFYGPPFGYHSAWPGLATLWGGIGGYVSIVLVVLGVHGVFAKRDALGWLLAGWIILALAKTFDVTLVTALWNFIPGVAESAFARYAQASWELAFVILSARALDDFAHPRAAGRTALIGATLAAALALALTLVYFARYLPYLWPSPGLRNSAAIAATYAMFTGVACLACLRRPSWRRAAATLAVLVASDSIFLFAIPTASHPRHGKIDLAAIEFLRGRLGLQRFFSLGPIAPNYGAYFGIASINHNYLPLSRRWGDWVKNNIDGGLADTDAAVFDGRRSWSPRPVVGELRRNLAQYEWAGVKYVISPADADPIASDPELNTLRKVYSDTVMTIYELADPKPYFETQGCAVTPRSRTEVLVKCDQAATLVRRELNFPGWTASVNGERAPVADYKGLFQAVEIGRGTSEVIYRYAPPHIEWAWLAAAMGLLAFALPLPRRLRARDDGNGPVHGPDDAELRNILGTDAHLGESRRS